MNITKNRPHIVAVTICSIHKVVIIKQIKPTQTANQGTNHSVASIANPPKNSNPSGKRNPWFFYSSFWIQIVRTIAILSQFFPPLLEPGVKNIFFISDTINLILEIIFKSQDELGLGIRKGKRKDGHQSSGLEEKVSLLGSGQRKRDSCAWHRCRNWSHSARRIEPYGHGGGETCGLLRYADWDQEEHLACDWRRGGPELAFKYDPNWRGTAGEGRALGVFKAEDWSVWAGEQAKQITLILYEVS